MELITVLKEGDVASFIPMVKDEEQPRYEDSSSFEDNTGIALALSQPSIALLRIN